MAEPSPQLTVNPLTVWEELGSVAEIESRRNTEPSAAAPQAYSWSQQRRRQRG